MELDIRRARLRIRIPETAGLEQRGGYRPGAEHHILQPGPEGAVQFGDAVIGMVAGAFADDEQVEVILHVGADAWQVVVYPDADRFQMIGRADAGLQEQLRRADGAGGDQHLALGANDFAAARGHHLDADRARSLQHDAGNAGAELDRQVLAAADRREIGERGGGAAAIALGQLVETDAGLLPAVEIVIVGNAEFLPGADIGIADRQGRDRHGDAERPAIGMVVVGKALVVLCPLEIGQDRAVIPALAAVFAGPEIVIGRIAARIELRVDRGAAADHLSLGIAQHAALHVLLRHGFPAPARHALGHLGKAGGHVEQWVPVAAAGLDQQHVHIRVFAEAIGKHASRRPGACDDVVVAHMTLLEFQSSAVPAPEGRAAGKMMAVSAVTVWRSTARHRHRSPSRSRKRSRRRQGRHRWRRYRRDNPSASSARAHRRNGRRHRRSCRCG